MLEKVLYFQKTSMFLTDASEDIDALFRYIASKKYRGFFEVDTPILKAKRTIYMIKSSIDLYCIFYPIVCVQRHYLQRSIIYKLINYLK